MKFNLSFSSKLLALSATTALVLAACGGSSGSSAPSTSPMSVSGTITGFGSVIIDGVRYEDTTAKVSLDTNLAAPAGGTLSDLKLGMRVEATTRDGKLGDVVVHAALLGPIANLNSAQQTFTLYGQAVQVVTTGAMPTVFDGARDFNGLAAGDVVEVHGTVDATHAVVATRVERKPQAELTKGARIGGVITALNPAAKTFKFNDMTVDFSAAVVVPDGTTLTNGQMVVAVSDTQPGAGGFIAKALKVVTSADSVDFGVGGRIMAFTSASDFTVSGVRIDASTATFNGGNAADLAAGVIVSVQGAVKDGVLKAATVRVLKSAADVNASLKGQVTDWVSSGAFKVRGASVDASAASFVGGSASDLGSGAWVLVNGKVQGDVLKADTVQFQAPPAAQPVKLKGEVRDYNATAHSFHFLGVDLQLGSAVEYVAGSVTTLTNGKRVEVTGTPGANGLVIVTKVEFLGEIAPQVSVVTGRAFDVTSTGFSLPGIAVSFNGNTTFRGGTANDLATGVQVQASGVVAPGTRVVAATLIVITKVETTAPHAAGAVTDFKSVADFRIGGQKVNASQATFTDGELGDLANGATVEATGTLGETGGVAVLQATRLHFLVK